MSTLIPKFGLKNGGSTPNGAVNRAINLKLAESVSVKDFGAVGDGTTNDASAIQNAINFVATTGGSLYFPCATYKINSAISHPSNVLINLQNSTLDFSSCTVAYAWAMTSGGAYYSLQPALSNGTLKGVSSPASNVFSATTNGLDMQGSNISIYNVTVTGFKYGIVFESNSYGIKLFSSQLSCCGTAWYANATGKTNMGAGLQAIDTSFAHNNYCLYNNLCEASLINCSFDTIAYGVVQLNTNSVSATYNSTMIFQNCRFENIGQAGYDTFVNTYGIMVFRDPLFFDPFNGDHLFNCGGGSIQITGGLTRIPTGSTNFYLSTVSNSGVVDAYGFSSITPQTQCVYLANMDSGVYNGDFELGTTAGWSVTTGTGTIAAVTTPHSGTYAMKILNGGADIVVSSIKIPVPAVARYALLNCYYTNANTAAYENCVINFYSPDGTLLLSHAEYFSPNTSTYTLLRGFCVLPNGVSYAQIQISTAAVNSAAIIVDDFYLNFN
jgi:hypothetical protein